MRTIQTITRWLGLALACSTINYVASAQTVECETQKLIAGDGTAYDQFGISVSLSGDHAIAGAHADDDNGEKSGSAYICECIDGVWTEAAKLAASGAAAWDYFGASVSVCGDCALDGHGARAGGRHPLKKGDHQIGKRNQTMV